MADQIIKDKNNKIIGKIVQQSSGKLEIRNSSNRSLGFYDPKTNETRDSSNKLIGKGNLLTTLLF